MANRIQGITVEIGGDTTKLSNALKGVNSSIKNTQSQLKDVQRLLKLDPTNTELLAQKEKLLTQAIDDTKEKLKTLKTAAEQANDAFSKGEISQSQYDALQREIIETEQSLKDLNKQAKESESAFSVAFTNAGKKLEEFGSKVTDIGKNMTKYVTGPIVGIGAASIAAFNEVDAGLDTVATKTGATGDELAELQDSMKAVYGSMAVSAEEAGNAIGGINTRFGVTGDTLETLATQFIEFAQINGTDLNTAIDSVDSIMKKFGIDSADTEKVLGLLTKAGQDTGLSMDTLEQALQTNGAAFKEMGLDLTSSVNLLAQMESSGVDTATAMAGLKKAVANATKDGKSAEEALTSTIESIKGAKTETEALAIASELFGNKGAPEMTQAIREGRLSLDDLKTSLSEYSDVVDTTFQNTQDAPDQAKVALNNLKLAGTDLATSLFNAVAPALQSLVENLQKAVNWFANLDEGTKQTIIKIAAIVAAVGPVLVIVGKVISAVGTVMTIIPKIVNAIGMVKNAFSALSAIFAANPIGIVIAAVTALVAAFIYLWNNCDGFRQFWIDLWENIKAIATEVWEGLKAFFEEAWNAIQSTAQSVWEGISSTVTTITTAISEFITTTWNAICSAISTVLDAIKNVITTVWNAIKTAITTAMDGIKNAVTTIWNSIKTTISTVINTVKNIVSTAFNNILTGIKTSLTNIFTAVKGGFSKVKDHVTGLASEALTWGKDLVMGIVNGIKSCIDKVGKAAKAIADKIRAFLHFSVPDEGPLTDYESWMPDFMKGLANGIEKSRVMVKDAMKDVANDLVINPKSDLEVHANGGDNQEAATIKLTQPLMLDGHKITTLVSQIQYRQGKASLRNLGTV